MFQRLNLISIQTTQDHQFKMRTEENHQSMMKITLMTIIEGRLTGRMQTTVGHQTMMNLITEDHQILMINNCLKLV